MGQHNLEQNRHFKTSIILNGPLEVYGLMFKFLLREKGGKSEIIQH